MGVRKGWGVYWGDVWGGWASIWGGGCIWGGVGCSWDRDASVGWAQMGWAQMGWALWDGRRCNGGWGGEDVYGGGRGGDTCAHAAPHIARPTAPCAVTWPAMCPTAVRSHPCAPVSPHHPSPHGAARSCGAPQIPIPSPPMLPHKQPISLRPQWDLGGWGSLPAVGPLAHPLGSVPRGDRRFLGYGCRGVCCMGLGGWGGGKWD